MGRGRERGREYSFVVALKTRDYVYTHIICASSFCNRGNIFERFMHSHTTHTSQPMATYSFFIHSPARNQILIFDLASISRGIEDVCFFLSLAIIRLYEFNFFLFCFRFHSYVWFYLPLGFFQFSIDSKLLLSILRLIFFLDGAFSAASRN